MDSRCGEVATRPVVLPEVEVAGTAFYHVTGTGTKRQSLEGFGTIYAGESITVTFDIGSRTGDAERREIVESVMASFDFTG